MASDRKSRRPGPAYKRTPKEEEIFQEMKRLWVEENPDMDYGKCLECQVEQYWNVYQSEDGRGTYLKFRENQTNMLCQLQTFAKNINDPRRFWPWIRKDRPIEILAIGKKCKRHGTREYKIVHTRKDIIRARGQGFRQLIGRIHNLKGRIEEGVKDYPELWTGKVDSFEVPRLNITKAEEKLLEEGEK